MVASADGASGVEVLDGLVRVVRADADGRHQLAVRAAFVGALARSHPEVVREPGGKRAWTPAALSALAAATTALLESKHELHCVVGVDDFAVNVSYKKKSLVYLRAETAPALRVLTYASLPAASGDSNRGARADENQTSTTARGATTETSAALATRASDALRAAARAALDDDGDSREDDSREKDSRDSRERRAASDAARLRASLQAAFPGAHWHVAHDWSSNPLGFAPAASATDAVSSRKGDFAFAAWRHASRPPGLAERLGLVAADRATVTFARRSFLVVCLACALWYNRTCDGAGVSKKPSGETRGAEEKAEALTAALCAAAPRAAPFALVALTLMGGNYAMGLARRVAAHGAGRKARKSKAA